MIKAIKIKSSSSTAIIFNLIHFVISLFFLTNGALAEIYDCSPHSETPVYCSNPDKGSSSRKVSLKKIARDNLKEKIREIKQSTPSTCLKHDGIDCSLGPDKDGSVICGDGYKKSLERYRLRCLEAVLEVMEETLIQAQLTAENSKADASDKVQVSVRNKSSIPATGVVVEFLDARKNRQLAYGPTEIGPYEIADYSRSIKTLLTTGSDKVNSFGALVRCNNCGSN